MERKRNRKNLNSIQPNIKKNIKNKTKHKKVENKVEKMSKNTTKIKKNKRYRITPRFYISIFLFFLIVGLVYILIFGLTDNRFNIKNIKIIGNTKYNQEIIDKEVITIYNENIFKINKKRLKKSLNKYSYIYDINLDRKLPSSLIINILERNKCYIAYNKETSEYIRLDKHGIILEAIDLNEKEDYEVVLFGINFDNEIIISTCIEELEIFKLKMYEDVSSKFREKGITTSITSAEFTEDKVIITLGYNISIVIKADENLEYNIEFLKNILKEIEGKSGKIDMTRENPTFSEIR